jgi:hypothetical protein
MFHIPNIYKNIIFVVFILIFLFLHSNEKFFNQFFIEKKSMGYLFIFVIIYLIYHQFNLAILFIPFFVYQCIQHPKFHSKILQHPKIQIYSQKINDFFLEIGILSKSKQEMKEEEIETETETEMISIEKEIPLQQNKNETEIEKETSQENIKMDIYPQVEIIEQDENEKSTPIHSLKQETQQEEKILSMEELQELYLSIQEELQEIDKKNISI